MISGTVFAKRTQPPSKSKLQQSLGQVFVLQTWLETQKRASIKWHATGSGQRRRDRQKEVDGQLMIKSGWGARRRSPDPGTIRGPWTRQGALSRSATMSNNERAYCNARKYHKNKILGKFLSPTGIGCSDRISSK
jgi:hypothetical protein